MFIKLLYQFLETVEDRGKLIFNSIIFLYLTITAEIKNLTKQVKERMWIKGNSYI